jgi:hypothetical protein
MDRKYRISEPSKVIAFVGDNFIIEHLYDSFKRYSLHKAEVCTNILELKKVPDFIIDCTFNYQSQKDTLDYSEKNNVKKVIIINHWKIDFEKKENITIIQAILPDVFGIGHSSFSRKGFGNEIDTEINYCNLICEAIRRIHEAKINGMPISYIYYGIDKVKYIYVENLYEPIEYMLSKINTSCYYEIYDEERNVGNILWDIKDILEYKGDIIFENTENIYNKPIRKLSFEHKFMPFNVIVRKIYNYLLYENERFNIFI